MVFGFPDHPLPDPLKMFKHGHLEKAFILTLRMVCFWGSFEGLGHRNPEPCTFMRFPSLEQDLVLSAQPPSGLILAAHPEATREESIG